LWLLAGALAAVGQWDQSAVVYERAISDEPTAIEPRLAAAGAWLAAGQPDAAIRQCEFLASVKHVPPGTWLPYAQALLAQQLQLPVAQRNWATTERILAKLPDQGAEAWQKPLLQSKYHAIKEEPDKALAAVQRAETLATKSKQGLHDVALAYEGMQK